MLDSVKTSKNIDNFLWNVKQMVRQGIPEAVRGKAWMIQSNLSNLPPLVKLLNFK